MFSRSLTLTKFTVIAASAIICLVCQPAGMADTEQVTVTGLIGVADQDDEGNVTAVEIWDSELGSVLIDNSGMGKELLDFVGVEVTITGTIEELDDDSGYDYRISVAEYHVEDIDEDK